MYEFSTEALRQRNLSLLKCPKCLMISPSIHQDWIILLISVKMNEPLLNPPVFTSILTISPVFWGIKDYAEILGITGLVPL